MSEPPLSPPHLSLPHLSPLLSPESSPESSPQLPLLRLRPAMLSDPEFVTSVETDPHNLPFIAPWERTQHKGAATTTWW